MRDGLDFDTRKAVAKWARDVALEDPQTEDHTERLATAKTMLESISPRVAEQDSALSHVVFLVRTFAGEDADAAAVETAVGQIMDVFVGVGAFR